ncbi:MAG: hypothetical protein BroJett018_18880 [Chloroflexota bacterium]|nr:hypothetical protein [Chloroflexota bacterium]NOG62401.1 hypothetical protein [Chloroflexota bacterium]GIK64094.1 MAG: hypothetical protein BroJett018_18880 [Chloroflexota bacterium]
MDYFKDLVQDPIQGQLWKTDVGIILVMGDVSLPNHLTASATLLAEGDFIVRYAIPYLGMSHLSVVPSMFVSERGAVLTGWTGWNFGVGNYQLYPRAEFYGLRSDGEKAQAYLRELDFGADLRVLAYHKNNDLLPITQVDYLIYAQSITPPPFLVQSLPPPPDENNS